MNVILENNNVTLFLHFNFEQLPDLKKNCMVKILTANWRVSSTGPSWLRGDRCVCVCARSCAAARAGSSTWWCRPTPAARPSPSSSCVAGWRPTTAWRPPLTSTRRWAATWRRPDAGRTARTTGPAPLAGAHSSSSPSSGGTVSGFSLSAAGLRFCYDRCRRDRSHD